MARQFPPPKAPAARRFQPVGAARVILPAESEPGAVVERPDGFYWVAADGRDAFGPFATAALARADRDAYDDSAPVPGETLEEAESEIGIAAWIDPDTGEPAEGQATPHLPPD